jgi:DNA-binding GntR family transcriptional regulator
MHIGQLNKSDNASQDHHNLVALARSGDIAGATELLRSHISNTKIQVIELIKANRLHS